MGVAIMSTRAEKLAKLIGELQWRCVAHAEYGDFERVKILERRLADAEDALFFETIVGGDDEHRPARGAQ